MLVCDRAIAKEDNSFESQNPKVANTSGPGLTAGAARVEEYFPRAYRLPIRELILCMAEELGLSLKGTNSITAEPCHASPLLAKVDLRTMMAKGFSSLPKTAKIADCSFMAGCNVIPMTD